MRARIALLAGISVALAGACFDPVHSDAVSALGPEDPHVRRGPEHRPGQPCLVCHGGEGPGSPDISVAGTVYLKQGDATPAEGATVTITDATGHAESRYTNRAGNFFIYTREWEPTYPLSVVVTASDNTKGPKQMTSHIGRDGSCATCHSGFGDGDPRHVPSVYVPPLLAAQP